MSLPLNYELDMDTQKWASISNFYFNKKIKPSPEEVIFIDVSKSRYLAPFNNDSSENETLVNRQYLSELFKYIVANNNNIKYLFADIIFDFSTKDDDSLISAVNSLGDKFLSINTYSENGVFRKNILGFSSATATITMQDDAIYKVPFIGSYNDTLVPLKIYSDIQKIKFKSNFLFTWFEKKGLSFNSQINNHFLRRKDFLEGGYIKIGLGELISLIKISPDFFNQYLRNRFIIIGDFENDVHDTYLNLQPGSLILYNAYLHLKFSKQILSVWFLIFLYFFIYLLVWLHFYKRKANIFFKIKIKFFKQFIIPINILSISILIVLFTFFSSLVFGTNISLFHLIAIFSIIEIIQFLKSKLEIK